MSQKYSLIRNSKNYWKLNKNSIATAPRQCCCSKLEETDLDVRTAAQFPTETDCYPKDYCMRLTHRKYIAVLSLPPSVRCLNRTQNRGIWPNYDRSDLHLPAEESKSTLDGWFLIQIILPRIGIDPSLLISINIQWAAAVLQNENDNTYF